MATTSTTRPGRTHSLLSADPVDQAFLILRTAFTVAPIVFGLDKFFNILTDWPQYLAPFVDSIAPGSPETAMMIVGSPIAGRNSAGIAPACSIVRYEMQRRASSRYGATIACVGHL